jgi:hypothetical protein
MPSSKSNFKELSSAGDDREPLMKMIDAYRDGIADYAKNAPEDAASAAAYAERSYRTPRTALQCWKDPAKTLYGAVFALRMAAEADDNDDAEVVSAMLRAALGYFEANLTTTA